MSSERESKKKPSLSQVLKTVLFVCLFVSVSQIFSVSSKPRVIIPASPQLLWSVGQARACCPEDPRYREAGGGSSPSGSAARLGAFWKAMVAAAGDISPGSSMHHLLLAQGGALEKGISPLLT